MPQIITIDDLGELALSQEHLLHQASHCALARPAEAREPEQTARLAEQPFLLQSANSPCKAQKLSTS